MVSIVASLKNVTSLELSREHRYLNNGDLFCGFEFIMESNIDSKILGICKNINTLKVNIEDNDIENIKDGVKKVRELNSLELSMGKSSEGF